MRLPAELLAVLACPATQSPLVYFPRGEKDDDDSHGFLLSPAAKLRYRIDGGVPVMLADEAQAVTADELTRLLARAHALQLPNA